LSAVEGLEPGCFVALRFIDPWHPGLMAVPAIFVIRKGRRQCHGAAFVAKGRLPVARGRRRPPVRVDAGRAAAELVPGFAKLKGMKHMPDLFDPPAVVCPAEDLAALAHQANAEHEAGERLTRKGLEHYRLAGEYLLKAKARCGHGKWLAWLKANVRFSQQTASNYMRLAENWDKLPTVGNLREALRVLTKEPLIEVDLPIEEPLEVDVDWETCTGQISGDRFSVSLGPVGITAMEGQPTLEQYKAVLRWLLGLRELTEKAQEAHQAYRRRYL
jgi:hypothetical protein